MSSILYSLPKNWRWVKLGEVLKEPLKNGLNFSKEDIGKGTKLVNVLDIFCNVSIDTSQLERVKIDSKGIEKYKLQKGDILVVRSSLKKEGAAYLALFLEDKETVVFCGFLIRIRPDESKVSPLYLLYYLRSSMAREKLVDDSDTVTITNVDQGNLLSVIIPLPPIQEQTRIAAKIQELMQEVKQAKQSCEKQLEASRALPSAYLRQVFESEEAKRWERKRLGEVCEVYQPQTITMNDLKSDGSYKVYGANGIIGYYDKYNHEEAEVLVTCRGATCGTVNVSEPKSWITGNSMVVHPKSQKVSKHYLYFILKYVDLFKAIYGSAQPQITRKTLEPIEIFIPSFEIQDRIAVELKEKMQQAENLQSAIRNQQSTIDALPQAILRKAFRGEL